MTLGVKRRFESKMFALSSPGESRPGKAAHNGRNVVQIFSVVNEALSRVPSDESLLDCWSGLNKALINMIVVVCFLKRHTRACVRRDCRSSAKNGAPKVRRRWFRTTA